jgi:dUTP pyrophosphatase
MKIHFKKLDSKAQKPKFGKPGDAGADLTATSMNLFMDDHIVYGTGLAVEIPEGMVGLVFPRSSIRNTTLSMANSVGVIDSGYRGEILISFKMLDKNEVVGYTIGDRIAQLVIMPVPLIQYKEVDELSETQRGTDGHGSTGK